MTPGDIGDEVHSSTINDLLNLVSEAMQTFGKQKTSGEPLKIKEKVLSQLSNINQRLYDFQDALPFATTNSRLDLIERKLAKIDNIESTLKAIKEATTTSFKEMTEATTNSEKP